MRQKVFHSHHVVLIVDVDSHLLLPTRHHSRQRRYSWLPLSSIHIQPHHRQRRQPRPLLIIDIPSEAQPSITNLGERHRRLRTHRHAPKHHRLTDRALRRRIPRVPRRDVLQEHTLRAISGRQTVPPMLALATATRGTALKDDRGALVLPKQPGKAPRAAHPPIEVVWADHARERVAEDRGAAVADVGDDLLRQRGVGGQRDVRVGDPDGAGGGVGAKEVGGGIGLVVGGFENGGIVGYFLQAADIAVGAGESGAMGGKEQDRWFGGGGAGHGETTAG